MQKKDLKTRFEVLKKGGIPLPENLTDETLLTRGEAATYARCSIRTLITWIDERGLREVKQGRYSRIRKRELDRFLDGENDESGEDGDFTFTEEESYQWFREACEEVWEKYNSKEPDADYEAYLEMSEEIWQTEGRYWK